jgi:hypothetical protein
MTVASLPPKTRLPFSVARQSVPRSSLRLIKPSIRAREES